MHYIILLTLFFLTSPAQAAQDPLLGYWQTENKDGIIELYPCKDQFCGRFVWLKDDTIDNPSFDDNNQDPDKRNQPLCGLTFLGDFEKREASYDDGWVYSPRHGSRFSAKMKLLDKDTLTLHGYFLVPILGDTQTWQRVKKPDLCWAMNMPVRVKK